MADQLKPFTCTYQFEGRPIGITIEARSWDDVSGRLRAIGMTAVVNGEQVLEVDAIPGARVSSRWVRKALKYLGERCS